MSITNAKFGIQLSYAYFFFFIRLLKVINVSLYSLIFNTE